MAIKHLGREEWHANGTPYSKNQIIVPKEAREAMKVKSHHDLLVVVKGGVTVTMAKPRRYHAALAGTAKGIYPKAHLKTERYSW